MPSHGKVVATYTSFYHNTEQVESSYQHGILVHHYNIEHSPRWFIGCFCNRNYFVSLHPHRTSGDLWFGLSLSGDDKYHHEDGTIINSGMFGNTFKSVPWASSEPTGSSNELCVRLRSEGSRVFRWADIGCSRSYPCLCQGVLSKLYNAIKSTTSLTVYHI